MIQRSIVLSAVMGLAAIGVVVFVQAADRAKDVCVVPERRAELRAARHALADASYDVQAAWAGGSLYAAAKVPAVDPAEVERATKAHKLAFERLQRARAACGVQVAA